MNVTNLTVMDSNQTVLVSGGAVSNGQNMELFNLAMGIWLPGLVCITGFIGMSIYSII